MRKRWDENTAAAALRRWTSDNGAKMAPTVREWCPTPAGMPSSSVIFLVFGSWNAAWEAIGVQPNERYASNRNDADSMMLQLRVDAGETLSEIAAELGISQQALGRRLARYRERHPEYDHYEPHAGDRRRKR